MSDAHYGFVEQDTHESLGESELPTYDDLAEQNGPNSRFGRWRGWIEKRAAERYADITHEERQRRRERGWGNDDLHSPPESVRVPSPLPIPDIIPPPVPAKDPHHALHIRTSSLTIQDPPTPQDYAPPRTSTSSSAPIPFISTPIPPSHLKINHFGSRFLPHTTSPIRCVVPLLADSIMLVGHDEGLSVLDMFPQEWTDNGEVVSKGPDEAQARPMWIGEGVFQMSILEMEDVGGGNLQGVVLAVVGPPHDSTSTSKDVESIRTARMYNLASLISLARYAITHKGSKPVELYKVSSFQVPQTPSKKHRNQVSITRGIKTFRDGPSSPPESNPSYSTFLSPSSITGPNFAKFQPPERSSPSRQDSGDSTWDVIDDMPLRWATDYVPLASPGSRLLGSSVISFATWCDENRKGKGSGGQLLAISTKSNIFLYETPKGERAYRFVKEFYTPLQPRSVSFVQQSVADGGRPSGEGSPGRFHSHKRSDSGGTLRGVVNSASSPTPLTYGTHLSLFVVFEKKAGWIRLADSAVGEVELGEDSGPLGSGLLYPNNTFSSTTSNATIRARARLSFDIRETSARWAAPIRLDCPLPGEPGSVQPIHVLTRGKRSHIVPCPLPARTTSSPPLKAVFWKTPPKAVSARIIHAERDTINTPPLLQLIAFTGNRLEIQELSLSFLANKGKGRAYPDDIVRAEEEVSEGDIGFLTTGGNWDRFEQLFGSQAALNRSASSVSYGSIDSTNLLKRMRTEEGVYGWCQKGHDDWRVFWVGGSQGASSAEQFGVEEEDNDEDIYW